MIYQIKIALDRTQPPIWRRVQVPAEITLDTLHCVIQMTMGWENDHLYQFTIKGAQYAPQLDDDFDDELADYGLDVRLCDVVPYEKTKLRYVYDFGDNWEHTLTVDKIMPPVAGTEYPVCVAGKRTCPPEDCGGVWGYDELLDALKHPKKPQYQELLEWASDFDPEAFDLAKVNTRLRRCR